MKTKAIKNFLKNKSHLFLVLILALLFFAGTSYYNSLVRPEGSVFWQSPDENANYVFTKLYGQTGEMKIFEKYNLYAQDIMHPRSIRSDWGQLKPVSFLGIIIIYGRIASILGYKIIPCLTPFFASLGIVFYYLLLSKIFGRRNALVSVFLLAGFPPLVYYSARSMFHNVLFLSLLIISLYFSYLMVEKVKKRRKKFFGFKKSINWLTGASAALGGFFLGLALMARTSEALWLLPIFFILWLFNFRRVGLGKLLIFLAFVFIGWLPAGYWNQVLFGSPFYSGYPEMNNSLVEITRSGPELAGSIIPTNFGQIKNTLTTIKENVFYFGFDLGKSWLMFKYYFIKMFPWLFFLGGVGLLLHLQRIYYWRKRSWLYLFSLGLAGVILVLYYGSWEFFDNPDATRHTIGNSYTRYWLPIYAGFIPFFSLFLIKFSRGLFPFYKWQPGFKDKLNWLKAEFKIPKSKKLFSLRAKFLVNGLRILVVYLIILLSLNFVLFGSEEGLFYSLDKSREVRENYEKVIGLTETNAVIITNYQDKIFFPTRKVIVGDFSNKEINKKYAALAQYLPVYYYNFSFSDKDLKYLNNRRLKEVGLSIDKIDKISYNFSLYKLNKK